MRQACFTLVLILSLFIASAYAQTNENGKKLFNNKRLGNSSNERSCNTCHPAGKGIDSAKFAAMDTNDASLKGIVNKCIEGPLMGKALPTESQEMNDIVQYIKSLGNQK
ncbi:MAG: cytochrome C [Nitrospirae bacterium]|nr:cytochrome C [Nitrospirota bacterium]